MLELAVLSELMLQPLPCVPIVADELDWCLPVGRRRRNTDAVFQQQLHDFRMTQTFAPTRTVNGSKTIWCHVVGIIASFEQNLSDLDVARFGCCVQWSAAVTCRTTMMRI